MSCARGPLRWQLPITLIDGTSGPVVAGAGSVEASVEAGHWVALRGTDFPLDWSFGQPAWEHAPGSWAWVSREIEDGPFEYKALLDDATWQVGEDIEGTGCTTNSTTPTWEEPDDGVDARDRG